MNDERRGAVVLGVFLIAIGGLFFLLNVTGIDLEAWPLFIILPGVALFVAAFAVGGEPGGGLAIAGSIVTTVGLILAVQEATGLYATWSYAWALVAPTGPGLGLLGYHTMIDTHFAARRRLHRLFFAIARNPELMGLGIDEDTALVVRGHLGRVVGAGGVTFVDGRSVRFDNAEDVRRGAAEAITLSYLRVGLVGAGHVLNLRERELEAVVNPPPEERAESTPTVTASALDSSSAAHETGARPAS